MVLAVPTAWIPDTAYQAWAALDSPAASKRRPSSSRQVISAGRPLNTTAPITSRQAAFEGSSVIFAASTMAFTRIYEPCTLPHCGTELT